MISNIYVQVLFGDHERESADSDELITSELDSTYRLPLGWFEKRYISGKWGPQAADENHIPLPLANTSKDINVHTNIHIYKHFNTYHTIYFHGYKFILYSLLPLSLSLALSSWYCGSMGTGQISCILSYLSYHVDQSTTFYSFFLV